MTDLLLLTNQHDYSLDRVVHWLSDNEPSLCVRRVNREELLADGRMSAVLGDSGWEVNGNVPRVVWLRQFLPERDPFAPAPSRRAIDDILVSRQQWLAWMKLLSELGSRWINDPTRTYQAEFKVLQLSVAKRVGFPVPQTLVTSNLQQAKTFVSTIGPSVVKSISAAFWEFSDQSFVFTVDAEKALASDATSWQVQPVFVQERIDGSHEARLFVIGDRVVAACRPRTTLDWRSDPEVEWSPWNPDQPTLDRALRYAQCFGLDYGAFDLILDRKGHSSPVFLECNPSGDFGFVDDDLCRRPSVLIGQLVTQLARQEL